jgi:glycerol-3-phosphate acyltransferase PlsX
MRILLDVMGGDLSPRELVRGGIAAGRRQEIDILFSGDPVAIRAALAEMNERERDRFAILPTTQTIGMNEPPVRAVRGKRDSSLVKGLISLKEHEVDAFVSPGNTGAVVAGSIFILGRIEGIPRPAIAASIPTVSGREILVLDMGANVDCAPEHLLYFALMGVTYARDVLGIPHPTVGLLNIGSEKGKGNRLNHLAYDIFLKTLEGGISTVTGVMKSLIGKNVRTKMGGLLLRPVFAAMREKLSYHHLGGAPLLGVEGSVVIAHGRSNAQAIASAITVASRAVESRVNETIEHGISGWRSNGS